MKVRAGVAAERLVREYHDRAPRIERTLAQIVYALLLRNAPDGFCARHLHDRVVEAPESAKCSEDEVLAALRRDRRILRTGEVYALRR